MGAPWNLCEARLAQWKTYTSAANDLSTYGDGPPDGKIWVILAVGYMPSVAETKLVSFQKVIPGIGTLAILNPISLNLNPAYATPIEQGMEYFLLPNERIQVSRDSATAGSTMSIAMQIVEIDMPLYVYDEPQVVKRQDRALSSIRQRLGGGGGSVTYPSDRGGDRGGRTGPLQK